VDQRCAKNGIEISYIKLEVGNFEGSKGSFSWGSWSKNGCTGFGLSPVGAFGILVCLPAGSGFGAMGGWVSRPISGERDTPPRGAHNLFDSSIAVFSVAFGDEWQVATRNQYSKPCTLNPKP